MKSFFGVAGVLAVLIACGLTLAADDKSDDKKEASKEIAWFDMDNCAICACMGDHKELMTEIKWETHIVDNGMLSITIIPRKHRKTVDEAHKKMESVIAKAQTGEPLEMCGFCSSMGGLMAAGAKNKEIKTQFGAISLMTASDEKTIAMIKEHAKKTQEVYKKMLKEQKAKGKAKKDKKKKDSE